MTRTEPDHALENLCQVALGDWRFLEEHTTQRPGSHVWRVKNSAGLEFVAKRHLTQQKHQREGHAYRQWVPTLAERAPRLIQSDPGIPGIIMTAIPGQQAADATAGPSSQPGREADHHHQAGELLRHLHTTAPGAVSPETPSTLTQRLENWMPRARLILTAEELALVARSTADLADADTLPLVPCHLDYQPRNWVIDANGVLRILDFEHARLEVDIRDFVRLEFRHWTARPDLREAFYDGYGLSLQDRDSSLLNACAAMDSVTAIVRGKTSNNPMLAARGYETLHQIRAAGSSKLVG
jgi:phosphotransferase family enzyme